MLNVLLASRAPRRRSAGGLLTSVALHAGVIAAVVVGTARATSAPPRPPEEIVYVAPRPPAPPDLVPPSAPAPAEPPRASGAPAPRPATPALPTPIVVPDVIPPVDPGTPVVDASEFAARGLVPNAVPGVASAGGASVGVGGPGDGTPYDAHTVERAVVPLGGAPPRYPDALRAANVEGRVVAEFVVDAAGRVEPASVHIVESTHDEFARAVRRALGGMRFRPAEVAGRPVRQLVQQAFGFALARP